MEALPEPGRSPSSRSLGSKFARAVRGRFPAVALACIVLVSLVYELHVSGRCSIWIDEACTYLDVKRPWPAVLRGAERAHPPLLFILMKLVVEVFGLSVTSIRSVSMLSGCALLVAVYLLCVELGLSTQRALIAVASFALAPFFIRHAAEARHYALYPALGTFASFCVLRSIRQPARVGYLVGFAASAAAMAATQYFGLAYACALLGLLLVSVVPKWKRTPLGRRRAFAAGVVLLALLGVLAWVFARAVALARYYGQPGLPNDTLPWRVLLRELIDEFSFAGAMPVAPDVEVAFAVAGLALLGRSLPGALAVAPAALALAPCALSLLITSGHFVAPRYLAPSWVLYHLGAIAALFGLGDVLARVAARSRPRLGALLRWAPILCTGALRLALYPREFGTGYEDYRGLQTYFRAHFGADTALVTFRGLFGQRIMGAVYGVGSPPIWLENFRPRPGITRYVVAEIEVADPDRQAMLEDLVEEHFGLTPAAWRALPILPVPHSEYQESVVARLVMLDEKAVPPSAPKRKEHHHHRHHQRRAEPEPDS